MPSRPFIMKHPLAAQRNPDMVIILQLFGGQPRQGIVAPKTEAQLDALTERRDELRDQLESLNDQRGQLANQISRLSSDDALRAGPMNQLRATDQRIAQVSADLAASDELIAAAKANGVGNEEAGAPQVIRIPDVRIPNPVVWRGSQEPPWQERLLNNAAVTIPTTFATVILLGGLMYWRISRSLKNQLARLIDAQSSRLDELQRSVDTVAVEVERVSEGQRFVTKLVGDKPSARV